MNDDDPEIGLPIMKTPTDESLKRLEQIEKKLEISMKKNSYLCCSGSNISKDLVTYIGQISVSIILLSFSFYSLSTGQNKDLAIGILSGVSGYLLPNPKIKNEN